MEINPASRQNAKDALAYVTAIATPAPGDPGRVELLKQFAAEGTGVEDLLAGAVTLISMLVAIRKRDGIPVQDTLRELGESLTLGE